MEKLLQRRNAGVEVIPFELGDTVNTVKRIVEDLRSAEGISFDIIKIPTGGATSFEIPTDDPNSPETAKEIIGVIIEHKAVNALWEKPYNGENEPPSCYGEDAKIGRDTEGNIKSCRSCEFNQFGSGANGKGKKCKNMMRLYIMLEGEALPVVLVLPPTSIPNFNSYLVKRVATKGLAMSQAVTSITLSKTKNRNGIAYSEAAFALAGRIEADASIRLKNSLQAILDSKETDVGLLEMDSEQ